MRRIAERAPSGSVREQHTFGMPDGFGHILPHTTDHAWDDAMTPGKQTARRFEPTKEELRFLKAFAVLFAPKPERPETGRSRASLGYLV